MLLNEHQSKVLFAEAGIPVPQGVLVDRTSLDVDIRFDFPWFLKSQVLTGGRGKAGGIKRVDDRDAFRATAAELFRLSIKGHDVHLLRVEPGADIHREFYLSFTVSRARKCVVFTVGKTGGVEIENLGHDNLLVQDVFLPQGLAPHQVRAAFFHMGLEKEQFKPFADLVGKLWNSVLNSGLLLAEINPLVLTGDGEFIALDGKVEVDDNMVDIFPDLNRYYQPEHASFEENAARDAGLSFVKLGGWVGLMVNGAGLAMATMDLLNFSRLPAANFLDLGGGANVERMKTAFELLFGDDQVQTVFINLFGGILSCEKVAQAMSMALDGNEPPKPMVVRMSGFQAREGLAILRGMKAKNIHLAEDVGQAISILDSLRPASAPSVEFTPPRGTEARPMKAQTSKPAPLPFGPDTRVLVQGITGREGTLHAGLMKAYGTKVVAGVTPFKGGQAVDGVPVYSSIRQAQKEHRVDASIIFVPPRMAADAIMEAAACQVPWAVCITEGIPQKDMLAVLSALKDSPTRLIGPNTPGLIVPGQTKVGILPTTPFSPGPVAILSRSGTLTYEVADRLNAAGIGQSFCAGIGGDPFIGSRFTDFFKDLRHHDKTKAVVVLGEIGGTAEEELADYVRRTRFPKPVLSFIAGQTAPPGKRLGHAGAILEKGGGIDGKIQAMDAAGFTICDSLASIPGLTAQVLGMK